MSKKRPAPTRAVPLFSGRQQGVVKTDGRGDQTVIPFTGDPTTALLGDGTFGPVATGGGGSGNVSGPGASDLPVVDGNFAQWDGTAGDTLKDGGYSPASFDAAGVAAGLVAAEAATRAADDATLAGAIVSEAGTRAAADTALAAPDYLVKTATATLAAERVVTDNTDITGDWSVAGVVKFLLGAFTGDITKTAGSLATAIGANKVLDTMLRAAAACSVIGRSANSSGNVADITSSADGQVLRRAAGVVGWGAVDLADSDAVTGLLPLANLAARTKVFGWVVGGGGSVFPTGFVGVTPPMPEAGTITKVTMLSCDAGSPVSSSATFDLWNKAFGAGYPPAVANTIINTGAGGTKPAVSTATNAQITSFAHWTTGFSAGDVFALNVDANTAFKQLLFAVEYTTP